METQMTNTQVEFGKKFFQWRDYTPIPLIIIMLWLAKATAFSAMLGTVIIVCGELFRIYSVAFIGKISRTRSDNTGNNLITSGPFAFVRNPLYVGNFLISTGMAVFSGSFAVTLLTIGLFTLQYYFIVQYEEHTLSQKFGQEFDDYRAKVNAWFPKKFPSPSEIEWPSSYSEAIDSEKKTFLAIGLTILAILIFS